MTGAGCCWIWGLGRQFSGLNGLEEHDDDVDDAARETSPGSGCRFRQQAGSGGLHLLQASCCIAPVASLLLAATESCATWPCTCKPPIACQFIDSRIQRLAWLVLKLVWWLWRRLLQLQLLVLLERDAAKRGGGNPISHSQARRFGSAG